MTGARDLPVCAARPTPRTHDMFAESKPPRQAPRKLMHVCDASGCAHDDGSGAMVRMSCKRCGYESDWLYLDTVTEAKRGLPCPGCIPAAIEAAGDAGEAT